MLNNTLKIIAFNGPPGSGKDTACDIIQGNLHGYATEYAKLASPLKDMASDLLYSMGHKDLADSIEKNKNTIIPGSNITIRQFLIELSERMIKPFFGNDIWAKMLVTSYKHYIEAFEPLDILLISDIGFQYEVGPLAAFVGQENFYLIKLQREGHDFSNDSRGYINHTPSNTYVIENNGSEKAFDDEVLRVFNEVVR